ncbi:hypothetical protein EI94DRAFT_1879476, partial [Lactarius quietus]
MWTVKQEHDCLGKPTSEVIHIDLIARAALAHLLPVYGNSWVPKDFDHHHTLDAYNTFLSIILWTTMITSSLE